MDASTILMESQPFVIDLKELEFKEVIDAKSALKEQYETYIGTLYNSQSVIIRKYERREKLRDMKIIKEAKLLNGLNHPNIVMFMGISFSPGYIYQITEYMQEGSVYEQVHQKHKITINNNLAMVLDLLDSVAKGMNYLHGLGIIHGNLNSTNVLIDEDWNFKISDFGFNKLREKFHRLKKIKFSHSEASPHWFAPEIFRGDKFGPSSDVYSFGIFLWELVYEKVPYQDMSLDQMIEEVGKNPDHKLPLLAVGRPGKYFKPLIETCLSRQPIYRPNFKEIVSRINQLRKTILPSNKD